MSQQGVDGGALQCFAIRLYFKGGHCMDRISTFIFVRKIVSNAMSFMSLAIVQVISFQGMTHKHLQELVVILSVGSTTCKKSSVSLFVSVSMKSRLHYRIARGPGEGTISVLESSCDNEIQKGSAEQYKMSTFVGICHTVARAIFVVCCIFDLRLSDTARAHSLLLIIICVFSNFDLWRIHHTGKFINSHFKKE